jgi:hypothetical protein
MPSVLVQLPHQSRVRETFPRGARVAFSSRGNFSDLTQKLASAGLGALGDTCCATAPASATSVSPGKSRLEALASFRLEQRAALNDDTPTRRGEWCESDAGGHVTFA